MSPRLCKYTAYMQAVTIAAANAIIFKLTQLRLFTSEMLHCLATFILDENFPVKSSVDSNLTNQSENPIWTTHMQKLGNGPWEPENDPRSGATIVINCHFRYFTICTLKFHHLQITLIKIKNKKNFGHVHATSLGHAITQSRKDRDTLRISMMYWLDQNILLAR